MRKDQMALALLAAALAATVAHGATTVRAKADQRVWQTVMSPSAPLAWPWESGADSAHLSLSNRMTRTVTTHVVEKSGDDLYGSFAVTPPAPGEEAFYIACMWAHNKGTFVPLLVELCIETGSPDLFSNSRNRVLDEGIRDMVCLDCQPAAVLQSELAVLFRVAQDA